jgi:hypothetical protein
MEVETKREFTVTLKLSEREAQWLKSLMQNPLSDDESTDTAQMRQVFWDALNLVRV